MSKTPKRNHQVNHEPTPEEIVEECRIIHKGWSEYVRQEGAGSGRIQQYEIIELFSHKVQGETVFH